MRATWIIIGAVFALGACTEEEMPGPQDGRTLYMQNCAACHGADATGNGPAAADLDPRPADLTQIAARNGGTMPRAEVMSMIDGYARGTVPHGMPAFGELLEGDLVPFDSGDGRQTPTPRKLVALLEYLESVQTTE
ncbi:c-type cytochrome [Citreimonas sp.]|uniref:c-type cytochrome n=1 Tax=Citreimonas sp. TaxID=3036715 RepID=UPI0040589363